MRIFYFNRIKDISGCSGTGRVADGVEFDDGKVAVRWRTNTASTELWDNLAQCVEIHGHGGATVPVFIDDEMKQRGTDLDQILEALETQAQPVTAETLKSLHKALSHALPGVYVSFDGDSIGNKVAQAEALDDEPAIQDISSRIRAGGDLFHKWVQRHDGVELEQGGDEGLAKVPEKALEDLETFREDYKRVVSASVTVGVGKKISEATKARMLGKLRGKDRVETFSDSTESSLKAALEARGPQDEAAKMREAGFAKAFRELSVILKSNFKENEHPRAMDGEFTAGATQAKPSKKRIAGKLNPVEGIRIQSAHHVRDLSAHGEENPETCEHCGKQIKHVATIEHPESGTHKVGLDCAEALTAGEAQKAVKKEIDRAKKETSRATSFGEKEGIRRSKEHLTPNWARADADVKAKRQSQLDEAIALSNKVGVEPDKLIGLAGRIAYHKDGSGSMWSNHLKTAASELSSKKKVQKALTVDLLKALEVFDKAKPLPVGTIRAWSGKKYQKQSQGWIPVPVQGGKAKNDDSKSPRPAKAKLQIERRQNSRDVDAGGHIKRENSTGTKKPSLESPVQAKTNQHREADRSQGQGKTQVEDSRSTQSILEETLKEMSPEALNFSSGQKALTKDVDYAKIELIPNTATTKFGGTVGTTLNGKGQKVLVKSALATDEAFSTAHKEVAYFNCSRFFGLSNLIPECGGDQQDGTFYSVAEWRHGARPYDSRDREFLQGSVDDGTVHKAAVMNLLLGNVDRHGGNWLVKENRMVLIDNGFSFGFHGGARLPGSTGQIKPRTPRYLQMLLPEGDEVLQEEDFAAALNSVETPDNIKNWVKSLNEERLMQLMEQSHVPSASINQAVRNLQKAKAQVDSDPSFGALIASLLGGISGGSDK